MREGVAELGNGAVAVVCDALDHHGHAVRSKALIHHLLEGCRVLVLAGAAADGALDVVLGHVLRAGLVDGQTQAEVGIWVAAALSCSHDELTREPGENGAALRVRSTLLP